MRLLVYGFGPYRQFTENVTEKILRRLPKRSWLKKVVFPVRFDKAQFLHAVKKYNPHVILGLGQCPRGRLLRIEKQAFNRRREGKATKATSIVLRRPRKLPTNLPIAPHKHSRASNDAGDYVCNYSMYVILDHLSRRRFAVEYGFIHVPRRYDAGKAARILTRILDDVRRRG